MRSDGEPLPKATIAPLQEVQNECLRKVTGAYKQDMLLAKRPKEPKKSGKEGIGVKRIASAEPTHATRRPPAGVPRGGTYDLHSDAALIKEWGQLAWRKRWESKYSQASSPAFRRRPGAPHGRKILASSMQVYRRRRAQPYS
ncbi:hypothetical protein MMC31_003238 [Peltigera leucophlebia]|nr:hypothetical protein [Peltigera leucophlebia]